MKNHAPLSTALTVESFSGTMAHELTHFIKAKCTAEEWAAFSKYFKENTIGYERLVNQKRQEYAAEIGNRSEQAARAYAEEEAVASMCEGMLNDEAKVYEFCRANESLGQRILAVLDSVLRNFKQLLRGEREGSEVWRLGSDLEKVRETRDLWYEMLQKATDAQKAGAKSEGETMFAKMQDENGRWYIQAEANRVISSLKSSEWKTQISKYFENILQGSGSIELVDIEGDPITITGIAGKEKYTTEGEVENLSNYINKKKRLNKYRAAYLRANAALYIDEIVNISDSKRSKFSTDKKVHTDLAEKGFEYRTVVFKDITGEEYEIIFSVPENKAGRKTAYALEVYDEEGKNKRPPRNNSLSYKQ